MKEIEKLTDRELVKLALDRGAFTPCYETHSIFLKEDELGKLNNLYMLGNRKKHRDYLGDLTAHLKDARAVDLGAGSSVQEHERILREFFHVAEYHGVDLVLDKRGNVQSDALLFLGGRQVNSSICMAFGLLNEPIFGTAFGAGGPELTEIRYEYAKRLARQIYRVTSHSGIFFGAGIDKKMGTYLEESGFENCRREKMSDDSKDIWFMFPFMFRKT